MRTIIITTYSSLIENWPFFARGLVELNTTVGEQEQVDKLEFFTRHLDVVMDKVDGVIFLALSRDNKPLGFISGWALVDDHKKPTALVYAAYAIPSQQTNGKGQSCMKMLYSSIESWARGRGIKRLQTYSGRTSGAAVRWFGTYGFSLSKLLLTKDL